MVTRTAEFYINNTTPEDGAWLARELFRWVNTHFTTVEVEIGFRHESGTVYLDVTAQLPTEDCVDDFFSHLADVLRQLRSVDQ